MKKIFLFLSMLMMVCTLTAQANETDTVKFKLPNKAVILTSSYGTANTMTFTVSKKNYNTIVGFGYGFYLGNEAKGEAIGSGSYDYYNSYQTLNETYFLIVGRQISHLSVNLRIGSKSYVDYNEYKKLSGESSPLYESGKFYSKNINDIHLMYGGFLTYTFQDCIGVTLGCDNFNNGTVGIVVTI